MQSMDSDSSLFRDFSFFKGGILIVVGDEVMRGGPKVCRCSRRRLVEGDPPASPSQGLLFCVSWSLGGSRSSVNTGDRVRAVFGASLVDELLRISADVGRCVPTGSEPP